MKFLRFIIVFTIFWESQIAFGSVFPNDYHSKRKLLASGGTIADIDQSIVYFSDGLCTVTRITTSILVTHRDCTKMKYCTTPAIKNSGKRRKRQETDDKVEEEKDTEDVSEIYLTVDIEPTSAKIEPNVTEKLSTEDKRVCKEADLILPDIEKTEGDLIIMHDAGGIILEVTDDVAKDKECKVVGYGDATFQALTAGAANVIVLTTDSTKITVKPKNETEDEITTADQGGALTCDSKLAGVISKYTADAIEAIKIDVLLTPVTRIHSRLANTTDPPDVNTIVVIKIPEAMTRSEASYFKPLTLMAFFPITVGTIFTQ